MGCALALFATRWAEALPVAVQFALLFACLPLAGLAAWRVLRQPEATLELLPDGRARWAATRSMPVELDAARASDCPARLHEQWPLAVVRLLPKGPTVVFWPDTLCHSGRRTLRRWAGAAPETSPLSQFWMG